MQKRFVFISLFFVALLTLAVQAEPPQVQTQAAPTPVETEAQSPKFVETDKGYSITFPDQWRWQRDFMGLDVFAPAPVKNEQVGSLANISVVSGKLDDGVSLETFFTTNIENLKKALRDVKVVETGKVFLDGLEGRKVVYSHAMGDMKLRVVQYFAVKNGHGYIITCTSSEEEYPKYADIFESAVKSFKLD